METSKQWKRVPFDIELAKKIQSGEIEGRITGDFGPVRIVCFDRESPTPIIALYKTHHGRFECLCHVFPNGRVDGTGEELFIELLEEAPKHEFKVGDKVLRYGYDDDEVFEIVEIKDNLAYLNDKTTEPFDSLILYYRPKNNEFKPFDKVLVRDYETDGWVPRLFSCMNGKWYSWLDINIKNNGTN